MILPNLDELIIAIVGIGYVGLPLAMEFSSKEKCLRTKSKISRKIIAYDVNEARINDLKNGLDRTNEFSKEEIEKNTNIHFSSNIEDIFNADVFIITVPTPINKLNKPDLAFIKKASSEVGFAIKKRKVIKKEQKEVPVIIYESTVYPGATEEICVPLIELNSGLKLNKDFFCGYSPERINPGDKNRKISSIIKITSGSNNEAAEFIDNLYASIIKAGTFSTKSIKIAEAAKVIENTQRDLNIALVNEFSMIFKLLNLDTLEVLEAARTKWNFLDFKPGLVGGHCIGVDPYYLTYKSEEMGYSPEIVLAGRKINNFMPTWITDLIFNEMIKRNIPNEKCEMIILGGTFKENCPDFRNSKIHEMIAIFKNQNINLTIIDPYLTSDVAVQFNCTTDQKIPTNKTFDVIICAVCHNEFLDIEESEWRNLLNKNHIIFDLKGFVPPSLNPLRP